jgi:hypothetical protein
VETAGSDKGLNVVAVVEVERVPPQLEIASQGLRRRSACLANLERLVEHVVEEVVESASSGSRAAFPKKNLRRMIVWGPSPLGLGIE